ncbi:MAG: FAD-dependent oxidoreductase [Syntrophomonadaceae bacterium]|jgi:NADPH-dependent 2,4-dienoyl-CoA reductase/sulfur reductase-like enzyme/rhodanese-related sulfurtransferase|nr:FAD-dependent oxidoreductase [Syntrophomonadaceae bacterium]
MKKKIIIIGGVAAGASAAARLRRLDEQAEIIILEKGEYISFANCGLPYYIGGIIKQRNHLLVQTPAAMSKRFSLDIRTCNEATSIDTANQTVDITEINTGRIYKENYDYLIICTGSQAVIPEIPGINKHAVFQVRNIPDSDLIKSYIQAHLVRRATIIGGGMIGLEMTEMLHNLNLEIHIIESSPQILPFLDPEMASYLHRELRRNHIKLHLSEKVSAILGAQKVTGLQLNSGGVLDVDMVILAAGIYPNNALAEQAGLAIGAVGGIQVDEYLRTSDPHIYAAGDVIQVNHIVTGAETLAPLAGPANRQGWIAANNICGNKVLYKGAQGTSIIKLITQTAAATGLSEKELKNTSIPHQAVHVYPFSHAPYYPGAEQIAVKLLFNPQNGLLLGAQGVGADGVDKRIDVLATALRAKMTVFDLQELELAYAPPYSSAKDPINMAAYVAGNVVLGLTDITHWPQVPEQIKNHNAFLLDVRTIPEYSLGSVQNAYNIPLDEIRNRHQELPEGQTILIYCGVGLRSYIASRILTQLGYKVKNISGGYNLYRAVNS